jgi:hydroxypyruvate reductase
MALAAEDVLGDRIAAGFLNIKDGHGEKLNRIEQNECSHPVPDERGVRGATRIADIARGAGAGDLLICLISGGASALLPLPAPPVTLAEKQEVTRALLACGATIHQLNCVRKHISGIKGGRLAALAAPARVLTLILSDVIGDDLDVIGSGPTVPDSSTALQAREILQQFGVWDHVPDSVRRVISTGPETPKPGDPMFDVVENRIVGSNRLAADAAVAKAESLGYRPRLISTTLQGEAREAGTMLAQQAGSVIAGGETTVTLRGKGKGGRNQEMVLAAAIALDGSPDVVFLSAGTDGTDGPTDAAGAFATGQTLARAKTLGLDARDYLDRNDSYNFFAPLDDLLVTGPTGTNVMDIQILLRA